jgi:hypothetical protein
MKNYFAIIIVLLLGLLLSCSTLKKVETKTESKTEIATGLSRDSSAVISSALDTTTVDSSTVEIVRIDFYKPDSTTRDTSDIVKVGALKSITRTTIHRHTKSRGVATSSTSTHINQVDTTKTSTFTKSEVKEQPAKDPKRFRYIFYIIAISVVVVAAGIVYLKKYTKFFDWLRRIL